MEYGIYSIIPNPYNVPCSIIPNPYYIPYSIIPNQLVERDSLPQCWSEIVGESVQVQGLLSGVALGVYSVLPRLTQLVRIDRGWGFGPRASGFGSRGKMQESGFEVCSLASRTWERGMRFPVGSSSSV